MVRVYLDKDTDLAELKDQVVSVIGYGSQGRAQALNMRDSGVQVVVGLRPDGSSWKKAVADGFEPRPIQEAASQAAIVHILIPDLEQPEVYQKEILPNLQTGKTLGFSHGYNIHFKQIVPPKNVDVIMIAPKSPGFRMRELYEQGFGVPALLAVYQDFSKRAKQRALAMCRAIGSTRAGVIETTFGDETESDLFGEQAVLVGGLIELIKNGFEVLVEAGYPPELAYFEACNEMKLIMDLVYQGGFSGMLRRVSDTAKYGGLTEGSRVIDAHVRKNMEALLEDVRNGKFAKKWTSNPERSMKELQDLMRRIEEHPIEKVGRDIRKMCGLES
ncbi:ketol-acid reductoisomerase [[Eubacterium] cellulosolvens]